MSWPSTIIFCRRPGSFVRQVEAVKVDAVVDPLAVLAVGAEIMRRHRVDLGNAGEVRHSRRTDGTTAADLVAARIGVSHQTHGNDVQNRVTVAADGVQFLFSDAFAASGSGLP